jgi:TBC1 domain family member 24
VKVTDCFLMEGMKVLYRVALALVSLFAKFGSNAGAVWEEQFTHGNYSGAMITFCKNLPVYFKLILSSKINWFSMIGNAK